VRTPSTVGLERRSRVGIVALALALSSPALLAAENLALSGSGALGLKPSLDSGPGTETPFYNAGSLLYINDGDPNTRVDTYNGGGTQTVSYVGIHWEQPLETPVVHLDLTLALFGNGGWFGVNEIGPSPGGLLTDEHLVEPRIEVTRDGGATWETVAASSDYYLALRGSPIGAPNRVTARFTLAEAAAGLNGIRIIGTEGGTVSGGFLGVFELAVVPAGVDSDADGMEDDWETAYQLSVGTNDSAGDLDGDGRSNLQEYTAKTNPKQADTDGDGLSDGAEVNQHGTHPQRLDTDGDTLSDGHELTTLHTNPLAKDTDDDGYPDGMEVSVGTDPTNPENYPENIAILGQGILGGKPSIDSGPETETHHANSGSPANVNDGNLNSRVDTYGRDFSVSFVGIVWPTPISKPVAHLDLTLALFSNGGWFGANGIDPGAGGQLAAEHLVEPRVEVTTDGGATWNVVAHTSDYISALTGHGIGGGQYPNPNPVTATFTLAQPAVDITGIRLAGTDGGTAGNGFLGVFELTARTPVSDTDNDGMPDSWERLNGLTVGTNDSAADRDSDDLSNLEEFTAETDPRAADSDGDGLNDGPEVKTHMTNPLRVDTDGDELRDSDEVNTHRTNPLVKDTDNDRFSDFAEVAEGTDPNSAASVPNNIAPLGRGVLGRKPSIDSDVTSEVLAYNAGTAANINDGNLNTRVDNYGRVEPVSFVGILWDEPMTNNVIDLQLTHTLFSNGGWFGVGGTDPGAGGLLTDQHLVEPRVEITTDGGQTWTVPFYTSDYFAVLTGTGIGGGSFPNPNRATATFTIEPVRDINGIRLVGPHGGTASGGFLGVFELAVHTDLIQASRVLNISSAGGEFRFEFHSQAGVSHVVQFKMSLSDASWQTHTTIAGDGTRKQVVYNMAGTHRIFRVLNQRIP
jgi:hypothetical protein